jgi:hypothetical protein
MKTSKEAIHSSKLKNPSSNETQPGTGKGKVVPVL